MEKYSVYISINLLNNRGYVGMTNGNKENYYGSDKQLLKDIKEFGKENFSKTILGIFNEWKECHYWEGFYVKTLKTHISQGGYNKDWNGGVYIPMTESKKKNISNSNKGKKRTAEQCKAISERHKLHNPFAGKHHSEETKEKLRLSHKGKKPMLGKHHSEETKKKISENNVGNLGKIFSKEHKEKISISNKGKKRTPEQCARIGLAKKGKAPWNKGLKKNINI